MRIRSKGYLVAAVGSLAVSAAGIGSHFNSDLTIKETIRLGNVANDLRNYYGSDLAGQLTKARTEVSVINGGRFTLLNEVERSSGILIDTFGKSQDSRVDYMNYEQMTKTVNHARETLGNTGIGLLIAGVSAVVAVGLASQAFMKD